MIEERDRGVDIFCIERKRSEFLYYGSRDRYVRSLDMKRFEKGPVFEPPHFECITSLAWAENTLVSGSRDKNLRSWDTEEYIERYHPVAPAHQD